MKEPVKKPLKESFGGSDLSPTESAPITKLHDNPIVNEIRKYMAEKLKDVELVKILEDGDVYHMDLRFKIENPNPQMQYTREEAKHKAYDIKRALEIDIMPKFAIPSFSIAGVRTVPGPDASMAWCEFSISFIYANKGNIKPHYEALEREKKVRDLVEAAIYPEKQSPVMEDSIDEAPKPVVPIKLKKFEFEVGISVSDYTNDIDDADLLEKPALKQAKAEIKDIFGGWPRGLKILRVRFLETDSSNVSHAGAYYAIVIAGPKEVIAKFAAAKAKERGE